MGTGSQQSPAPTRSRRRWLWLGCLLPFVGMAGMLSLFLALVSAGGVCLPYLDLRGRRVEKVGVDITPLAELYVPTEFSLPVSSSREAELYFPPPAHPELLVSETLVYLWRNPFIIDPPDALRCDGKLEAVREAGARRYYCTIDADEQVDELGCGLETWDAALTIQKGQVFIAILNYTDETPDGETESEAIRRVARIWGRRIAAEEIHEFYAGEYAYQQWCAGCHGLDAAANIAPALLHLRDSTVALADGSSILADDAYLLNSILAPGEQVVAGYAGDTMPAPDRKPNSARLERSVPEIVAYLTSLSAK